MARPVHRCHAVDCDEKVRPRLLMCRKHWYMVPKAIRDEVLRLYVPGQEVRKDPTEDYLNVAQRAINVVAGKEGKIRAG
jgi:hypothetical protein